MTPLSKETAPPESSADRTRKALFEKANGTNFDVVIIGAGISGARIYHELCQKGHRVLLFDRADFASGTSQTSGLMIWGGLLYLKDLDVKTVRGLCRARDELIERLPEKIRPQSLRYLPRRKDLRNRQLVRAGMILYWLLGSQRRRFPDSESTFPEQEFLKEELFGDSLTFEEAMLEISDCRFALEWILPHAGKENMALNYCEAESLTFDASDKRWRLDLRDRLRGEEAEVTAGIMINAAGVWTDELNLRLGTDSPYRHELSKGVYVSVKRPPTLQDILIFDTGRDDDTLTFAPWGPVAMCGPTETSVASIPDGFRVSPDDVRYLLGLANANLDTCYGSGDIVSLRCGIRPLGVRRGRSKVVHPLKLSRKHLVHHDPERNLVAVYGGKLTSCGSLAEQVCSLVSPQLPGRSGKRARELPSPMTESFPGLEEPVPSATWCRDHEHCHTLGDYLRRRTNIAQWVPRGGLGIHSENLEAIRNIARVFAPDEVAANASVDAYREQIRDNHDQVLTTV